MLRAITKFFSPTPPPRVRRFEGAAGGRRLANAGVVPAPALAGLAARGRLAYTPNRTPTEEAELRTIFTKWPEAEGKLTTYAPTRKGWYLRISTIDMRL